MMPADLEHWLGNPQLHRETTPATFSTRADKSKYVYQEPDRMYGNAMQNVEWLVLRMWARVKDNSLQSYKSRQIQNNNANHAHKKE